VTTRWSCALLGALLVSCSLDKSGAGSDISLVQDSALPDDGVMDDVSFDVERDTFEDDTGTPDSTVDGADADSEPDGEIDAAETGGDLAFTCMDLATGTDVNLTTEGTQGWAHYGRVDATSYDHKAAPDVFSALTVTGGPIARYGGYVVTSSWSDGAPSTTATGDRSGVYPVSSTVTMTFDVTGNGALHMLHVYLALDPGTKGGLTVTLGAKSQSTTVTASSTRYLRCSLAAAWSSVLKVGVATKSGYVSLLSATLE
jgi:hypothetical protein